MTYSIKARLKGIISLLTLSLEYKPNLTNSLCLSVFRGIFKHKFEY